MNPPKCSDDDYINFLIATPRSVSATEAAKVQGEDEKAPAHDAFTRTARTGWNPMLRRSGEKPRAKST